MVVYSEVERIVNQRRLNLEPYLAVVTKQQPPDAAIFKGFLEYKDEILDEVSKNVPRIIDLKAGLAEPIYCKNCDYCRSLNKTELIDYKNYKDMER
jgi:hypothetical protein